MSLSLSIASSTFGYRDSTQQMVANANRILTRYGAPTVTNAPLQIPSESPTTAFPVLTTAGPKPIITSTPATPPIVAGNGFVTTMAPSAAPLPAKASMSLLIGPGVGTMGAVGPGQGSGSIISDGIGSLINTGSKILDVIAYGKQIFGGGGAPVSGATGTAAPIAAPGGVAVNQAGMLTSVGKVFGAIARSKTIRTLINGVLVYATVDALGNILKISDHAPHRRMNVLNQRALSRANRRVVGFSRVARKTLSQLGYKVTTHRHVKAKVKPFGGRPKKRRAA